MGNVIRTLPQSEDDSRNMSMFVIIPDRIPKIKTATWEVFDNIEEFSITDLISSGTYSSIPIFLRKFKVESIIDIAPAAQEVSQIDDFHHTIFGAWNFYPDVQLAGSDFVGLFLK